MKSSVLKAAVLSLLVAVSGCATIVGSPTHLMPISSTPNDATILITDEKGTETFKGATPTTVTLPKSDGSYWGKKSYTVKISKPGYETQTIPVTASVNGWYLGGNFIFGGLIGWFIVDPLNGNMYSLSPESINPTLSAATTASHNNTATDGGITIMLIEDIPVELRSKMERIN